MLKLCISPSDHPVVLFSQIQRDLTAQFVDQCGASKKACELYTEQVDTKFKKGNLSI